MEEQEEPKRGVGRPKGHRLSPETRDKIRRGVRKTRKAQKELASTNPNVPIEVRAEVVKRDQGKCRGCHDRGGLKVHIFVQPEDGGSVTELDNLALLCPWCRQMARDMNTQSATQVP